MYSERSTQFCSWRSRKFRRADSRMRTNPAARPPACFSPILTAGILPSRTSSYTYAFFSLSRWAASGTVSRCSGSSAGRLAPLPSIFHGATSRQRSSTRSSNSRSRPASAGNSDRTAMRFLIGLALLLKPTIEQQSRAPDLAHDAAGFQALGAAMCDINPGHSCHIGPPGTRRCGRLAALGPRSRAGASQQLPRYVRSPACAVQSGAPPVRGRRLTM